MKTRVIPNEERDLSKSNRLRKLRRVIRASWVRSLALLGIIAWFVWLLLPKPPLLDGISFSQCVRDRNGKLLRVTLTTDQKFRVWTPLPNISPSLIEATLRFEDKYYRRHPGVNPVALLRSALNLHAGGAHSGASTITMQLARLRYHLCTRTLGGKFVQIVRALELERHYSKAEILEAYLNLAPYGRNIEGIGAASQIYFDKPASRLSRPEAVALSVIPQSPSRRALFVDRNNQSLDSAQSHWYDRAKINREFSAREFSARAQRERKFLAPHFVQQIVANEKGRDEIVTTLDLAKQQLIERRIADYIQTNRNRGIQNAAVLLVDTRTMDVLAQIGSADFFSAEIQGQVDGTRAPRSPGSTLKPFVYALALQQGLIHPLSILSDAPHSFGDYNPENFDREFVGPIRACDALARSRNLPAVELASQLHHPTLYEFLRGSGVTLPRSESVYGLSLPLGGAEVTMEDLVRLYAALANNGELRPLRRTSRDPTAARGRSIIMPEAAFLTLEMINLPRPEVGRAYSDQAAPVFWKTGTSHGFRDAWSIAVFNHYVLAVWIGNFDGRANGTFVGRIAAAPLLFQIIDSLRATWPEPSQPHLPPPGANLKRVSFCAVSGDLPEPYCAQHVEGWFIPGISPIKLCDVHQEVLVDAASGLRVARDDGTRQLRREVYEFWPTELLSIFRRAGVPRKLPPPFLPDTDPELVARTGNPPRIIAPAAGSTYEVLNSASSLKQGIPLRAKTDADVREVYWFADKTFIGKSAAADILSWKSGPGRYELTALDDHGRSGSCAVIVR
ncbi:MAG TPA: penicillin-binding protein 1C [Candidatus Acidoferrum sp.]|nr:penicillin-binding protein 1C [Candidatus Acidoferrum sp.]